MWPTKPLSRRAPRGQRSGFLSSSENLGFDFLTRSFAESVLIGKVNSSTGCPSTEPGSELYLTEAIWGHQWHNVVNQGLLKRMLRSPEPRARAAATRVLSYWRDRVRDPLALLEAQAKDERPRVRLEAVRACSFFKTSRAAEVALAALDKEPNPDKPGYYIKYYLDETMKALDKYVK